MDKAILGAGHFQEEIKNEEIQRILRRNPKILRKKSKICMNINEHFLEEIQNYSIRHLNISGRTPKKVQYYI